MSISREFYETVDFRLVWQTVPQRIPAVRPQVEQTLADYQAREG